MKKILFFLAIINLTSSVLFAQQGKDGVATFTTTTTVNLYTALSGNVTAGTTSITVASATGLSAGDLIYIIQMQGATVLDSVYEYGNPNSDLINDTSFGRITSYNGAGNNEFAEITSVSGNIITLDCALKNNYNDNSGYHPGNTQIVRVPRYISLTLTSALTGTVVTSVGQITCPAWNGTIGGVVAIEVQGNTSLGSGTSINAAGKGFRGGTVLNATGFGATNTGSNYGSPGANNGGHKGESIAGDTNQYKNYYYYNFNYSLSTPLQLCKGNVANGGGGGNGNNCGGGGGSNGGVISQWNGMGNADMSTANNIAAWSQESTTPWAGSFRPTTSSGGGRGGYAYSSTNSDPTADGPNSSANWGAAADGRHNDGGWGGVPLNYTSGKIFLGGGGGAGDSNDGNGTSGGNGGGIVYLLSYGTVTGTGQIIADGATALNTNWASSTFDEALAAGDDGAGGGGGGGAVFINSTGNISLTNTLSISAQGGAGGNYFMHNVVNNKNFGPGGGGGGGYVATTNTVTGVNVNGAKNGIAVGTAGGSSNASKIATKFPPNGATAGGVGTVTASVAPFYLTASNFTICPSGAVSLSVTVNGTAPSGLAINWYTVATGGTAVSNANPYNITAPATAGTYTYFAGTCPGTYRLPVTVTVNSSSAPTLSISATSTAICFGTAVTLTVSGATSYTWDANAGNATTNTVTVSPNTNTTYTLTGATTGACAGTNTASININVSTPPTITITPTSYSICSGINDTLTATGTSTSYIWSSNAGSATTSSVSVLPATTGITIYNVTGVNGSCATTQTTSINVTATPTVSISPTGSYICKGANTTFTASGATTYSWSTSATTNTISVSPTSNATYTVTGSNGTCSNTKTVLVKVDNGITKADSVSNTASCGQANGSYILNSVTGGISPYQINFNGTGFSAIAAFSYTVPSLTGNTYPIIIKDSLGCTYTTSVTIGNTSGITAVDTTITNANCNPANSGSITINSVTGGNAPYQANINGGTYNTISSFPYSFTGLTAGTYTVFVKDGTGCPHSSIIIVGSNGGPTAVAVSTQPDTCSKNVGTITTNSVTGGANPYQYSLDGTTYQTASTFTALAAGTYTVYVKDNNGCSVTTNTVVGSVGGAITPTITASGNTSFCQGSNLTLTSSSATSYTWSTGVNTQTITVSASGIYTVTTTSATGCTAMDTIIVTAKNNPATPTVSDTTINECSNSIQQIHFNHSTGLLIIHNSSGQIQTIPFTPTISGIYTAYDSLNGCASSIKNITVHINATPTAMPTVTTPVTYCQGQIADSLLATATTPGASLFWLDANHNALFSPPSPTPSTNTAGTTTYYVYQTINAGLSACNGPIDSIKVIVLAKPNPNFSISPSTDIFIGQTISFTPVQTTTANTYYWNFDDPASASLNTSTQLLPKHTYNSVGSYCAKLVVKNQAGCKDSTTLCLDVLTSISIVIPNVFSPNGDGLNEVFSVKTSGITTFACDIFDRWGLKLYSWTGTNGFWDGAKAVDGTYFYVIQTTDVKGEDHKYNGFIQLVK